MLQKLHFRHEGIESTLRRAREAIYWPNMKSVIKDFTSRCETCVSYSTRQQKETLISHDFPDRQTVHIPVRLTLQSYMVTVDNLSGFFEIDKLYDLKVSTVIRKLKTLGIALYGNPDEVESDSGSQLQLESSNTLPRRKGSNTWQQVPTTISLMVKPSLLSRKHRRSSKNRSVQKSPLSRAVALS